MGKKIKHVLKVYEEAYQEAEALEQHKGELLDRAIAGYRVKSIWSGPVLEVEAYPYWHIPQGKRVKRDKGSSNTQSRLNQKNKEKHVARLINVNFRNYHDLYMTLTYADGNVPMDHERARKDMQNYIRRMKHWLKKREQYTNFELKYIYTTEHTRNGEKVRAHHHMVTNFPDREAAELLWNRGRAQTKRLQDSGEGFKPLAVYLVKERGPKTMKSYTPSRNLKKPKVTVSDTKLTRRRAAKIATEEINGQEIFEKMYKNYQFKDMKVSFSDYVSGAYIQVEMMKIDTVETLIEMKRRLDI